MVLQIFRDISTYVSIPLDLNSAYAKLLFLFYKVHKIVQVKLLEEIFSNSNRNQLAVISTSIHFILRLNGLHQFYTPLDRLLIGLKSRQELCLRCCNELTTREVFSENCYFSSLRFCHFGFEKV